MTSRSPAAKETRRDGEADLEEMVKLIVIVLAAVALTATVASGGGPAKRAGHAVDRTCPDARKAIRFYREKYTEHREVMGLPGAVPHVRYGCGAARRRAVEWRDRARQAREERRRWEYQYAWWEWLPRNWYEVASCETGYGGDPNWSHANSSFVSAFGISRSIYDSDAAYMGAPPWNDADPPTPRQQYMAALGHYRQYGDGWGCPGP